MTAPSRRLLTHLEQIEIPLDALEHWATERLDGLDTQTPLSGDQRALLADVAAVAAYARRLEERLATRPTRQVVHRYEIRRRADGTMTVREPRLERALQDGGDNLFLRVPDGDGPFTLVERCEVWERHFGAGMESTAELAEPVGPGAFAYSWEQPA